MPCIRLTSKHVILTQFYLVQCSKYILLTFSCTLWIFINVLFHVNWHSSTIPLNHWHSICQLFLSICTLVQFMLRTEHDFWIILCSPVILKEYKPTAPINTCKSDPMFLIKLLHSAKYEGRVQSSWSHHINTSPTFSPPQRSDKE
jgi:hypothetical protein